MNASFTARSAPPRSAKPVWCGLRRLRSDLSSTASFDVSAEAQQMCTGDAFMLGSSRSRNIPAITAA